MTLVIATGGIDLSVGSIMAIAGRAGAADLPQPGVRRQHRARPSPWRWSQRSSPATLCGLFNGWLVAQFRIQPIVATLVLFIAGRGIAQALTNSNLQVFKVPEFQWIGLGRPLGIPVQVIVMVVLVLVAAWMLRRTRFGRSILAIGGNERAAELAGHRGQADQARRLCHLRLLRRHCRARRHRHQLRQRRQPRRPRHGARRHRRGRGRRHAAESAAAPPSSAPCSAR